ncbi:DUF5407 family protein [Candidatus Similichlamydia epinepheli]|uniref:DUF5407 family protein n=1 Tax=Candidatus Similichlamydia epinepheli TaxID=1903953 RepID=UPI000D334C3A|nr:DUF5407 family protein [Candidatus Similichlamydia epinepheli]
MDFLQRLSESPDSRRFISLPAIEADGRFVEVVGTVSDNGIQEKLSHFAWFGGDNLFAAATNSLEEEEVRCGCSTARRPFEAPYAGARNSLIQNGVFELAVTDWDMEDEEFGDIPITRMFQLIGAQGQVITDSLLEIENDGGDALSVASMFELQLKASRICQVTELGTAFTTSLSNCIYDLARNTKASA